MIASERSLLCIVFVLFVFFLSKPAQSGFNRFDIISQLQGSILARLLNSFSANMMVNQIYKSELQLDKANTSDTEAAFKTCSCQCLMILKFIINVTPLILKFSISHF